MQETKLKPCPFCGGIAEIGYGICGYNVFQAHCINIECNAFAGWSDTPEGAAEAWNKRTAINAVLQIES